LIFAQSNTACTQSVLSVCISNLMRQVVALSYYNLLLEAGTGLTLAAR
jgi:hypothetical protein